MHLKVEEGGGGAVHWVFEWRSHELTMRSGGVLLPESLKIWIPDIALAVF